MKTPSDAEAIVVSRTFERDDGEVRLSLYKPLPYPAPEIDADPADPPWRCNYHIDFPDGEITQSYSVGIDSMQALLLAISGAQHRLRYVGNRTPERRAAVRWLGSDDLGMSIDHFAIDDPI